MCEAPESVGHNELSIMLVISIIIIIIDVLGNCMCKDRKECGTCRERQQGRSPEEHTI